MDFFTLFPKLSEKCVTLSDLGVNYRVFVNWSEKGIIDYKVKDTRGDTEVTRKRVELNYFEALWILLVKELRDFGVHLDVISGIKNYLFAPIDKQLLGDSTKEKLDELMPLYPIEIQQEVDKDTLLHILEEIPNEYKMYFTHLGGLVSSVLLLGHSPSLIIHKRPTENDFKYSIFNPNLAPFEENGHDDFRDLMVTNLIYHSLINLPILPLISAFYNKPYLFKYAERFALYTPGELELLKIIQQRDFQQIKIYKSSHSDDLGITITKQEDFKGEKAREIRKILGLKQYSKAEVIYRNDQHIVIKNTVTIK